QQLDPLSSEFAQQVAARDLLDALADAREHLDDRHGDAVADQELGGLAAGRAAADDHDARAGRRRYPLVEELLRVDDARPVDPGDRREQRLGPGGDDDDVRALPLDQLGGDLDAGVDLDAERLERPGLVVAEAQYLALARRLRGDLQLPAEDR